MAIIKQYDKRVGITYAYESKSYWDKEKKQSRSIRKLIGIVDANTGEIVPTTKKKRVTSTMSVEQADIIWLKSNRTFYGATYLLDAIGESTGVVADIRECFPDNYKQILSIAYFLILEDRSPLSRFEKWNKLHTHPHNKGISSQRSSELFAEISETSRMHFFRLQKKRRAESEYWAFDTSSISSYAKLLRQVRYGKNKDHDPLPQINLALLFGEISWLPFFYKKLPGNISDVKTVKQLLRDIEFLGCEMIKLAMDRGFYSKKNIDDLCIEKLIFLMGTKLSLKYVRAELEQVREQLHEWLNYMPNMECYGITTPIMWKYKQHCPDTQIDTNKECELYLHFYYDSVKAVEDERDFAKLMHKLHDELASGIREKSHESEYKKYFSESIAQDGKKTFVIKSEAVSVAKNGFGYFVLIGNENMSAEDALCTYRNKDVVEKAFEHVKDRLDMRRMNVSCDLSLDGKLFVVFVALIYIAYLHKAMKDAHLYGKYTMMELLDELEMIERFEREGYPPQIGEVTTKQGNIFTALNFALPKSSLG